MENLTARRQAIQALENISFVLVGTIQPGNIGSAARAMKNMGLSRLKLVNPQQPFNDECRRMAGKAFDLIEGAEVYDTLESAVADDAVVAATTSARERSDLGQLLTPREAATILKSHACAQRVAVVFGPEQSGLTDGELARCQMLISIPANPQYSVLNLAQSVLLLAYELASAEFHAEARGEAAPQRLRGEMFSQMQQVLVDIGFLSASHPEPIMNSIRRLLDHPQLSPRDVRIVRGIFSQMEWYVREGWKLGPEKVRKP